MQKRIDTRGAVMLQPDAQDGVVHQHERKNRVVCAGWGLVAQLFGGVTAGKPPTPVTHVAVGSDVTPPTEQGTALLAESGPRKTVAKAACSDFDEAQRGGGSVRHVRVPLRAASDCNGANDVQPLREAAIYTSGAPANGVMYNRVVFDTVTKTNAFQLTLLRQITF